MFELIQALFALAVLGIIVFYLVMAGGLAIWCFRWIIAAGIIVGVPLQVGGKLGWW